MGALLESETYGGRSVETMSNRVSSHLKNRRGGIHDSGPTPVYADVLGTVARYGWATIHWEPTKTLHDLVHVLDTHTSHFHLTSVEPSATLVATERMTARPASKSAKRGLTAFPPHTDAASRREPPRFLLLRCLTAPSEFPTFLVSRYTIPLDYRLQLSLSSVIWVCRGTAWPHLSSVLGATRIRWDEDCMRPLDRVAKNVHNKFRNILDVEEMYEHVWSDRDIVLIIDNWNTLHARGSIRAGNTRILERLYAEAQ